MGYNPEDQAEKRKRLAWTVACESSIVTKEDPVLIYNKILSAFETQIKKEAVVLDGSCESQ